MPQPDPIGDSIAAAFGGFDVQKTRGGYTLVERRSERSVARIKPFPDADRFELFYWSSASERWKTFGPFGRMKLELDEVVDIVRHDPMFRIKRKGLLASLFG